MHPSVSSVPCFERREGGKVHVWSRVRWILIVRYPRAMKAVVVAVVVVVVIAQNHHQAFCLGEFPTST